jgi:hypothetical protein
MKLNTFEKIALTISTILFLVSCHILYKNWNVPKTTIESFAALEYCGMYVYTIYDHLKTK